MMSSEAPRTAKAVFAAMELTAASQRVTPRDKEKRSSPRSSTTVE